MITHFITVSNGIITGRHCGDIHVDFFGTPYHGHDRVVIPQGIMVSSFYKVEYYDEHWKRKPDIRLIDEGLMPMPEGYVREGDNLRKISKEERIIKGIDEPPAGYKVESGIIVEMSQIERINAGLEELPPAHKLVDGEIIPMTLLEQLAAGQITQESYEQILAAGNGDELQRRLAELQTPEVLAQAEVDAEYAVERKAKLAALLAVKKQPGWPVSVAWPE